MANQGTVVGKVALLEGQAIARAADGSQRLLKLGDVVYEGETIVTGAGSRVELAFEAGRTYLVREQEAVALDATVHGGDLPDSRDAALLGRGGEINEISRAIAEGGSLDALLEETALALTGGGSEEGHGFVRLLRIVEEVNGSTGETTAAAGATETTQALATAQNSPPAATDDVVSTDEDTPVTVAVRANDSDAENDPLTVTAVTQGAHGTVVIDPVSGNPVYTPNPNWFGTDSFTYTIDDGHGGTDTATVTVTVNPVNDAPVTGTISVEPDGTTVADPNADPATGHYLHTIPEDSSVSGQVHATDVDGDALVFVKNSDPAHGTATVNPDGSYTYVPDANYNGNDTFTVLVDDGNGGTAIAVVDIVITPVQDPSTITAGFGSVTEDTVLTTSGRLNIFDVDGAQDQAFVPQSGVAGQHGSFSIDANGNWRYNLNNGDPAVQALGAGQTMTEVFNVAGVDGTPSTVTVTINGVNENARPGARDDAEATDEGVPVTINVLANDSDPDGDPISLASFGQGSNGTVTEVGGQLVYTPNPGFVGTDTFTYSITDGNGATDSATVTVSVGAVNVAPTTQDDQYRTPEDTQLTIAAAGVLANDTDLDGDTLTVTSYTQPANGTVTIGSDGNLVYTPNANFKLQRHRHPDLHGERRPWRHGRCHGDDHGGGGQRRGDHHRHRQCNRRPGGAGGQSPRRHGTCCRCPGEDRHLHHHCGRRHCQCQRWRHHHGRRSAW